MTTHPPPVILMKIIVGHFLSPISQSQNASPSPSSITQNHQLSSIPLNGSKTPPSYKSGLSLSSLPCGQGNAPEHLGDQSKSSSSDLHQTTSQPLSSTPLPGAMHPFTCDSGVPLTSLPSGQHEHLTGSVSKADECTCNYNFEQLFPSWRSWKKEG